jgi:hypothetical protein
MARAEVKITNGDHEAMVSPRAAQAYARHGWTVVDDGSSESEAAPAEEKPAAKKTTSRKAE